MDRAVLVADADLNVQAIAETLQNLRDIIARIAKDSTEMSDARPLSPLMEPVGGPATVDNKRESLDRVDRRDSGHAAVDRCRLHRLATVRIAAQLRQMGLDVQATNPVTGSDFLVNDTVRIAVRAALRTTRRQRVRVGARLYQYQRHSWQFNFHRHGRIGRRYCDYFICLPVVVDAAPDLREALIIPWTARRGKTLGIPQTTYGGWYAKYRGRWEQLRRACEAARARHIEAA